MAKDPTIVETFKYNGRYYILLSDGTGYICDGLKKITEDGIQIALESRLADLSKEETKLTNQASAAKAEHDKLKEHKK